MGHLNYGGTQEFEFEDRTLAHLKAAITMKLRRQESFLMSWTNSSRRGGGRVSIWLSPSTPLVFHFAGSRAPSLNKDWIAVLNELSHTPRGLIVLTEEEAENHLVQSRAKLSAKPQTKAVKAEKETKG